MVAAPSGKGQSSGRPYQAIEAAARSALAWKKKAGRLSAAFRSSENHAAFPKHSRHHTRRAEKIRCQSTGNAAQKGNSHNLVPAFGVIPLQTAHREKSSILPQFHQNV